MEREIQEISDMLDVYMNKTSKYGIIKDIPFFARVKIILKSKFVQFRLRLLRRMGLKKLYNCESADDIAKIVSYIKSVEKLIIDMAIIIEYCKL